MVKDSRAARGSWTGVQGRKIEGPVEPCVLRVLQRSAGCATALVISANLSADVDGAKAQNHVAARSRPPEAEHRTETRE